MGSYLLRIGKHEAADKTRPPKKTKDQEGNEVLVYPNRVYNAGEMIESDVDLVKTFGPEKFSYPVQLQARSVEDVDRQIAELQRRRQELAGAEARVAPAASSSPAPQPVPDVSTPDPAVPPVDQARLEEVRGQSRRGR